MIERDQMTEGAVVAWMGPNGLVRGVVEMLPDGAKTVKLQNGLHMDFDSVADSPSSKIIGWFRKRC